MSQPSHPTLINMPQPPSRPDTPSEAPGTPTSTTTSLSALSTTAIKDGHRGAATTTYRAPGGSSHHHTSSTTSLEAEQRADRISRLTGLSNVSALRNTYAAQSIYSNPYGGQPQQQQHIYYPQQPQQQHGGPHMLNNISILNPPNPQQLTPAYFDPAGQPVAAPTKLSTVGSASATDRNSTSSPSPSSPFYEDSASGSTDVAMMQDYADEDNRMLSDREGEGDEDDDGSASLVGFGEGAGSTVSGPIYQRRVQRAGEGSAASAMANWGRAGSGLGQYGVGASPLRVAAAGGSVAGSETPVSQGVMQERREALMLDGVAMTDGGAGDDVFVDTSTRGPVPVMPQANVSAIRETQQPGSHQQQQQLWRSTAERIVGERLDEGEGRPGVPALGRVAVASGEGGQRLGQFYFEEGRR